MKKCVTIAILTGIMSAFCLSATFQNTTEAISGGVIRLHVVANSNKEEDQNLKLMVRDRVLAKANELLRNETERSKVRTIIVANLKKLEDEAKDEVVKRGYNYPVRVEFGKSEFPLKTYGDLTLPAGTYESLCVKIGNSAGENWWCVMFPPLCFVNESVGGMDKESKAMLIETIGKDAYGFVDNRKPQLRFKVYELWKKLTADT